MLPDEDLGALLILLQDLTPEHLSIVLDSLKEPNSQIGTTRDSAHGAFLAKLAELHLAEEIPLEIDGLPPGITSFAIKEEAKEYILSVIETALRLGSHEPNGGSEG